MCINNVSSIGMTNFRANTANKEVLSEPISNPAGKRKKDDYSKILLSLAALGSAALAGVYIYKHHNIKSTLSETKAALENSKKEAEGLKTKLSETENKLRKANKPGEPKNPSSSSSGSPSRNCNHSGNSSSSSTSRRNRKKQNSAGNNNVSFNYADGKHSDVTPLGTAMPTKSSGMTRKEYAEQHGLEYNEPAVSEVVEADRRVQEIIAANEEPTMYEKLKELLLI